MNKLLEVLVEIGVDRSWTLFLDRDGVINRRLPGAYVSHPDEFELLPGVLSAMRLFSETFGRVVVVTNQRGIALGRMSEEDLGAVHRVLREGVEAAGGKLDGIYYCPHDRDAGCECRKPRTGLAWQAKEDFPEIDFQRSVMIGDSVSDLEMGRELGMKTIWMEGKGETMPDSLWDFRLSSFDFPA